MNALELILESERVAYALGVKDSAKMHEFTQWVITLKWPNYNKEKGCLEYCTLEDLKGYFKECIAHPKNLGDV